MAFGAGYTVVWRRVHVADVVAGLEGTVVIGVGDDVLVEHRAAVVR